MIAYHVRQSFSPGEITPEEANQIGYEFASRFLKGNHALIVCTHVDKKHIRFPILYSTESDIDKLSSHRTPYHVIRQAIWAMENGRKKVQKK